MEHLSHPSKEPQFQDLLVSIEYVICMKRKNSQGSGAIATLVKFLSETTLHFMNFEYIYNLVKNVPDARP